MHELSALGFDPFFEEQLSTPNLILARIAAEHRGGYHVWSNVGAGFAQLTGRLTRELEEESYPCVGDWVTLSSPPGAGQTSLIERVLTRRTAFTRGAAGRRAHAQVIATNIDIVFAVSGLDSDYNIRRIERYLARIWASGAQPVVILNKTDVCENLDERVAEVDAIAFGVPVLTTSATRLEGMDEVRSHISPRVTAAFVGSSGAGKSTLINALVGEEKMTTRKISDHDGQGRHTTTHRQLITIPEGGLIIDTPGMRELQLLDEECLGAVFSDIEDISAHCRFGDCTHNSEPGCAIRDAVASGEISTERFEHYLKLQKEAHAYEVRHDEGLRRKTDKAFGKMVATAVKQKRRQKHGE